MLFFLLLIVPFASAQEGHSTANERCPEIVKFPETCPEGQIKCPSKYAENGEFKGCPTEISCKDMWFENDPDKTCAAACWDVKCKDDEMLFPGTLKNRKFDLNQRYGPCDRTPEFCVKFPDFHGNFLNDWADLGLVPTNVDLLPFASIVFPQSCADGEIWCHYGVNDDGNWLGSHCAKNAKECEDNWNKWILGLW